MKLGIINDIHEDQRNLSKAFSVLDNERCDEIACLGDITGFQKLAFKCEEERDANEVIRMVDENCKYVVTGNNDLYTLQKLSAYDSGLPLPENWYKMSFDERETIASGAIWLYKSNLETDLEPMTEAMLDNFPEISIIDMGDFRVLLSHFIFPNISGSATFFPSKISHLESHFRFMDHHDCLVSFSGHSHTSEAIVFNQYEKTGIPHKIISEIEEKKGDAPNKQIRSSSVIKQSFGETILNPQKCWITGPAVVRSSLPSGIMTFNSESFELKVIQI